MRSPALTVSCALTIAAVGVGTAFGAGRSGADDPSGMGDEMMVGNMNELPDLQHAGTSNVRRARRLLHASLRTVHRLDTLRKAHALGYRSWKAPQRPGFTHLRKFGTRFWGRVFDANAPQALVYWCPSHGRCTLAVYMYRAPPGTPPSTWGDLLMWHRHGTTPTASWMTHVWLVRHVREAFATCAPMAALEADRGIQSERYKPDVPEDRPCQTEGSGGDGPMPGMAMG